MNGKTKTKNNFSLVEEWKKKHLVDATLPQNIFSLWSTG